MPGEHPLDAAIVDRLVSAFLNDSGEFARGARMGQGQPHEVWLDRLGETYLDGRPAAGVREGAPIDQAEHPCPPEALKITPQSPIAQPRHAAVLGEGPRLPSHGPNGLVTRECVAIGRRITEEEVGLGPMSRRLRPRVLLPHERSTQDVREDSYDAESQPQRDGKDAPPLFCR